MYPNVMIIDQSETRVTDGCQFIPSQPRSFTRCSSGPVKNEFVSNNITQALKSIFFLLSPYKEGGWSVFLKEGLYIDPLMGFNYAPMTTLFPRYQVVGAKDVRILFTRFFPRGDMAMMPVPSMHLDLSNVRIYDFRQIHGKSTITVYGQGGTSLHLTRV